MRFVLILAFPSAAALAQADQDDAHRADRQRTESLNRAATAAIDQRNSANAAALARYRNAQAAYQRDRDAWRRRVAACDAGDDRACDPR
jgi:hypothetical protein